MPLDNNNFMLEPVEDESSDESETSTEAKSYTITLKDGANCGTGAGGFKPGSGQREATGAGQDP